MSRRLLAACIAALFALAWSAPLLAVQAAPQKQPPAKKAKKIWTNDDLETLRPGGSDATSPSAAVGPAPEASGAPSTAAAKDKDDDQVTKLRKRLDPLRAELATVESELRNLRQSRGSGRTSGGGMDVSKTPGGMNTENQIAQLEQRRADLVRQITDIEDEARRAGISPGAIR